MHKTPPTSDRSLWRLSFGHFSEADTFHQPLRKHILERDHNRCSACGLEMSRHMEVRNIDGDHNNQDESNLVCICPFCHLCDHIGPTGFASAGLVIGTTNITQGQLNALTLAIWYVQARVKNDSDIRVAVKHDDASDGAALQRLRLTADDFWREQELKSVRWAQAYSSLATEPDILGGVLNDLADKHPNSYANREHLLRGLLVLPQRDAFDVQCSDWFEEFDRTRPISVWGKGLATLLGRFDTTQEALYARVGTTMRSESTLPKSIVKTPPEAPTPTETDTQAQAPGRVGKRYAD